MAYVKRWFVAMMVGGTFLIGLTSCVVAPVDPVSPGYVVSPPVVVIRPHPYYRPYYPYGYYRPYRPYGGWYRNPYRW
ncbi:MAG: hypothetical protein M3361_18910 [Candidatus Tectomicrobia bacterium]|nr:hypothetical protein [Candidatus Tectomicrobia bacterium]